MIESENKPPRVFISYSHDSKEHKDRVLELSDRLMRDGVDVQIDQNEPNPKEGLPIWMSNQVRLSDFILCICTEKYCQRFQDNTKGGVSWEGLFIIQILYESGGQNEKIIPVIFNENDSEYIPFILVTVHGYFYSIEQHTQHQIPIS